ncbi:unnamed protein product [Rotaria sp. Silwood1]|nr:unnamed protein product [Rotaria sp. Silwood1]
MTATDKGSNELVKSRLENGRFINSFNPQYKLSHLGLVLIWEITSPDNTRLPSNKKDPDKILPVIRHEKPKEFYLTKPGLRFIWIGHASCFIQMNNFRFLVDPVFRQWFLDNHIKNVVELDWWEEYYFSKKEVNIAFCPAQHCSRRTAFDLNKSLWGSHAVWDITHKFYFIGDTGYTHNISIFRQIGKKYGPFDLSAIPIGIYEPQWIMQAQDVSPDEAVQIHIDVQSKTSIGTHWGGSWISTLGVGADGGWSISAEITTIPRSDAPFYCGQPQAGSCISVNTGSKINKIAQFSIGCATTTVIEVDIYKPDGMMVGPLKVNPSNSSLYTISITWTPTSMDIGTNLLCYTPLDDRNQQGDQVCIKYFVSDNDSKFARFKYINGSLKPVGQVYSNQSVWYIEYTNEVRRPSLDAYVRFYSNSTNKQVHQINVRTNLKDVIFSKNTLTFFTSINWILGEHYYILLDRSVVTDPSVCGPQSPPVDDVNFWTFEVQSEGCFRPKIRLIPSGTSLSSPLQFRRSQDFYILSKIGLNCNDSLTTTTKWTINNCSLECSSPVQLDQTIITNFSELFIPARTFPYGLYELKLTVTMNASPNLTSFASAFVRITPSGIAANLAPLGTTMITHGYQQNLILDPGSYSVDPDQNKFEATHWTYEYYCRIYGISSFQSLAISSDAEKLLCFEGNGILWNFNEMSTAPNSSLTITAGSLLSNRTYQFMVRMENRQTSSIQVTGFVLVNVVDTRSRVIAVACSISKMCQPNLEYQYLNPTTQVALYSICTGNCTKILSIIWNIYQGTILSSNIIQWKMLNEINTYENIWFYGR